MLILLALQKERNNTLKAIAYIVKCKSFSCPQYGFVKNYVDLILSNLLDNYTLILYFILEPNVILPIVLQTTIGLWKLPEYRTVVQEIL